jgi:hypothetical protein
MSETIAHTPLPSTSSPKGVSAGTDVRPGIGVAASTTASRAAYWQRELAGLPVLNLPTDKPRPATLATHFACQSCELDANLSGRLRGFCQNERVPVSFALLGVFQVLLLRYTSQEDMVIGCALTDAFLLRADLSGDPTFRGLVSAAQQCAARAATHGSLSLADLMEDLTSGLGVHAPTFQVAFFLLRSGPAARIQILTRPDRR